MYMKTPQGNPLYSAIPHTKRKEDPIASDLCPGKGKISNQPYHSGLVLSSPATNPIAFAWFWVPNRVLIAGTVGVRDSLGGGTYGEEAAHWVCSSRQNWDLQHPSSVPSLHDVQLFHKGRNTETRNLKVSGTVSHKKSSPCLRCFSLVSAAPTERLTHHLEGYNWEVGCGETARWSEHWPPFYRTWVRFPAPSVTLGPGASTLSTGLLEHFIHVVHRHTCNIHITCMHLYT